MGKSKKNTVSKKNTMSRGSIILYLTTFLFCAALIAVAAISSSKKIYPEWAKTTGASIEIGKADASKVVDVYEDFQCPGCGQFERLSGKLLADAVADGTARIKYHLMSFLGPESVRAANAAACSFDQNGFLDYHTILFQTQPSEKSGGYSVDSLVEVGNSLGFDKEFESCVTTMKYKAWVTDVNNKANADGITSTPTVLIDGNQLDIAQLTPEVLKEKLYSK